MKIIIFKKDSLQTYLHTVFFSENLLFSGKFSIYIYMYIVPWEFRFQYSVYIVYDCLRCNIKIFCKITVYSHIFFINYYSMVINNMSFIVFIILSFCISHHLHLRHRTRIPRIHYIYYKSLSVPHEV